MRDGQGAHEWESTDLDDLPRIDSVLRSVRTVAADTASRSSLVYAQLLFRKFLDTNPEFIPAAADPAAMLARARAIVRELNFDLRPNYKVSQLSRAHQQMVEIAKAFLTEVRLLILDEPTASLTDAEAAKLFDLIAKLKAAGVGIIYVSHRMREIKQIADRITVLRDGHKIKTVAASDV